MWVDEVQILEPDGSESKGIVLYKKDFDYLKAGLDKIITYDQDGKKVAWQTAYDYVLTIVEQIIKKI